MNNPLNILIVEDNPLNAELAVKLLEDDGHQVAHYTLAEEALTALQTSRPDLILMDMNLPGMSGYTAVSKITSNAELSEIPVVAFTAMALSGQADKALSSGCRGVIYKPVDVLTFSSTVESYARPLECSVPPDAVTTQSEPTQADHSRIQTFEHQRSISHGDRINQLAHETMTQLSILKTSLYYLTHNESKQNLSEKQSLTLRNMEEATEALRKTSRVMISLVNKND
jgi:two-component system cell cycle response regulator DivK